MQYGGENDIILGYHINIATTQPRVGTYMAEDLLHDGQALLLIKAAGRLNQNSSQVWADQWLWQAFQPQLQGSSQLQAGHQPHGHKAYRGICEMHEQSSMLSGNSKVISGYRMPRVSLSA